MKRIFAGIIFLFFATQAKAVIPFFPCDSVLVFSVNANYGMQRIEVLLYNTSQSGFNGPQMTGVISSNPHITMSANPASNAFLDVYGGPNGGYTGFAITATLADPSTVPSGTVFSATVTLYNPNDLSVSCDYPVTFTYGTGPVGIQSHEPATTLSCSPNPATDFVVLGERSSSNETTYFIYDCLGNLVLTSATGRVNISQLPAGVYFFRDEKRYGKFVKR